TLLILKFGRLSEKAPKLRSRIVAQIRKHIAETYMNEYLKNSKISKNEIDDWMLPVAAARLNEWIPDEEMQDLMNLIRGRIG
ncbi:hypothetical protein J8340_23060, partial [Escherichia coli]|nr:hypothetical protein [Escherichia coli]